MAITSSDVYANTNAAQTLYPGQVVNCILTIVNGTGIATLDHIEFPVYSSGDDQPLPGIAVSSPPIGGPNSTCTSIADSATLVVPFSIVCYAPGSSTIGTGASPGGSRSFGVAPIVYTTAGQVIEDGGNGNRTFTITAPTWPAGGGG